MYLDTLKLELENQTDGKTYLYNKLKTDKNLHHLAVINNKLGLTFQYESNLDSAMFHH